MCAPAGQRGALTTPGEHRCIPKSDTMISVVALDADACGSCLFQSVASFILVIILLVMCSLFLVCWFVWHGNLWLTETTER